LLKRITVLVLATVTPWTVGCLQKETSHTLYLSPDASVEWVASEANVRSDEPEIAKRLAEEQSYIGGALLGAHGAARALAALDPQRPVRTIVVRDERPFRVVTTAEFRAVDRVFERLFTELGIDTVASVVRGADGNTLRVRLDFSHQVEEHETPVSQLGDNIEHLRIVLTEGRFGGATGFDVADGTSATLSAEWLNEAEKACERKGVIELALSWSGQ
jgi:hypothetical protein